MTLAANDKQRSKVTSWSCDTCCYTLSKFSAAAATSIFPLIRFQRLTGTDVGGSRRELGTTLKNGWMGTVFYRNINKGYELKL